MALGEKTAEGDTGHVDPVAMTHDEIHWHVERVLGIVFKASAFRKRKGKQPAAAAVGISPDMATHGHETVEAAVGDRRVSEHGCEDRDQAHAHAKLQHRVGLCAEVEVDLDRGGLLHHAVAEGTDLLHIRRHKVVAGLGDPLDIVKRAHRLHAKVQEVELQPIGGGEQVLQVMP